MFLILSMSLHNVLQAATVLAKQLLAIRKQKTRMLGAASTVQAVGTQAKVTNSLNETYSFR